MMLVMTNARKNDVNRQFCNVVLTLMKALFTLLFRRTPKHVITLTIRSHVPDL
jgi:hypothetical protein